MLMADDEVFLDRRVVNFSAGPATLPLDVLEAIQMDLLNWQGTGMSVMELSHRGVEFQSIAKRSEQALRDLLLIPDHYHVLFLAGGATGQFAAIPMNLATQEGSAVYLETGLWSQKASAESQAYTNVHTISMLTERNGLQTIADFAFDTLPQDAAYLHYTSNETISGITFPSPPDKHNLPLVVDMSSDLLSQPIDVSQFGLIYACAQKNLGISGVTIVIVRDDLLKSSQHGTPSIFDYQKQIAANCCVNTPSCFSWYVSGLVFEWIQRHGGLDAMAAHNCNKAGKLYAYIDASDFYNNKVDTTVRSIMNVPFHLPTDELDTLFAIQAKTAGLSTLEGHRSVGGIRASLYNAMTLEGVEKLIQFMQQFEQQHSVS